MNYEEIMSEILSEYILIEHTAQNIIVMDFICAVVDAPNDSLDITFANESGKYYKIPFDETDIEGFIESKTFSYEFGNSRRYFVKSDEYEMLFLEFDIYDRYGSEYSSNYN